MSKKLSTHTRKFLRSDATYLLPEAIEEIRNAQNNIPNTQYIMCQKHYIEATTYQKIINNQRPPEPTEKCHRILDSVSIFDQISENNKESLQPVSAEHDTSPTNIQEDKINVISATKVALLCNRRKADLEKYRKSSFYAPIFVSVS
ncbi:40129_t:CDS:2 [Gigaspora margarita]|uniref:40129_t:CDS:1 n=1 Tax=Gigaspora margarita TaxID=4874 RepID=A0ABN7VR70_GIGMA|nr:40129_t:CDS:2 [Gigaspora margarita]